jgi:biotin carboxyl carrier protein
MIYEVTVGERSRAIEVTVQGEGFSVRIDGADAVYVDVRKPTPHVLSVLCGGLSYEVGLKRNKEAWDVDIYGTTHEVHAVDPRRKALRLAGGSEQGLLKTAMPGRVIRLLVEPGQEVSKGDPIIVVEAMKMENEMKAPSDGVIVKIHVEEGEAVEAGSPLILVE